MDDHTVTYDQYHRATILINESTTGFMDRTRANGKILDCLHKIGQDDAISPEVRLALMNDILERVCG